MDATTPNSEPPPRRPRLRSLKRVKTFTGCSTCRSRHLKCDEGRPECQRCVNAGVKCSGYPGHRSQVAWKPIKNLSSYRGRTSSKTLASGDSDIDSLIESNLHGPLSSNPVGVGETSPTSATSIGVRVETEEHVGREDRTVGLFERPIEPHLESDSSDPNYANPEHRLQILAWTSTSIYQPLSTLGPPPVFKRHLDELPNLPLQIQLIDHWVTHLSDALMPIPESHNLHKNIFVPKAYEGALSAQSTTSAAVALFYLLCATSAFHLSANTSDKVKESELLTLALYHHNRGISHLQRNLAMNEPSQQEAMLASFLLCITYEPSTVERSFWRTHFQGASSWLRKTGVGSLTHTESANILYQSLVGTAIFLRSQFPFDYDDLEEQFPFRLDAIQNEPYYLLQIFGLPKHTLEAISKTIVLIVKTRRHSCSEDSRCVPSRCGLISDAEFDRMEFELYLALPGDPEGTVSLSETSLRYHYTQMFYFASIIYFKRILRSATLCSVQPLVERSLDHIEALEACTSRPFSPFVWPIAVTFFEMKDVQYQRRALRWLDFIIKRSTLSIWPKFKALLCEFWLKRTSDGNDNLKWDEYLNDPATPDMMIV